jgi:DNA-binding NarL/FixJ family response regulator
MPPIRVLGVDDHVAVRRMICRLLTSEPTFEVVCESAGGEDAIEKAKEHQPDIVVLDISLPGISGIEASSQILGASPNSRIIFLSQHTSPHVVQEAFKVGGHGYVAKSDAGLELLEAIRIVSEESRFVSKLIQKKECPQRERGDKDETKQPKSP